MKRPILYKLEGKFAVPCDNPLEWVEWTAKGKPRVALDHVEGFMISTIFVALDQNWSGKGDPLLFETMVFLPNGDIGALWHYFTWEEAEAGHKEMVQIINEQIKNLNNTVSRVIESIRQKAKEK